MINAMAVAAGIGQKRPEGRDMVPRAAEKPRTAKAKTQMEDVRTIYKCRSDLVTRYDQW